MTMSTLHTIESEKELLDIFVETVTLTVLYSKIKGKTFNKVTSRSLNTIEADQHNVCIVVDCNVFEDFS